jgi:anthranilate synthase component II
MNIEKPKILIIDNYDSFTYNLVQLIEEHGGCNFEVMKNDEAGIAEAASYEGILFSPGPGLPNEAPVMAELLRAYCSKKSFLGICLGLQAIAESFGMKLVKLDTPRHGLKTTVRVIDSSDYLFQDMPGEFKAGLYHSWAVSAEKKVPESISDIRITALSDDGIIMAIAHTRYNIRGVQFHPESYLSENGHKIIYNWINNL